MTESAPYFTQTNRNGRLGESERKKESSKCIGEKVSFVLQ